MQGSTKRQRLETDTTIGYLGAQGSFTCVAAQRFFDRVSGSSGAQYESSDSLKDMFDRLKAGSLTYGVIPVESSTNGSLIGSYDFLLKNSPEISIVGEAIERDQHCLCAKSAVDESSISKVISHPVIVQDCSVYLDSLDKKRSKSKLPPIDRVAVSDSAAACKQLISSSDNSSAVICTEQAASLYGLTVICLNVSNDRNAETRYAVVSGGDPLSVNQTGSSVAQTGRRKASIAVSVKNSPGSMFKMISCFGLRDINIIKVESRPSSTVIGVSDLCVPSQEFRHWDTIFFVDYEPSTNDATNQALLANLSEFCFWTRTLGSYRQCGQPNTVTVLSDWGNMVDVLATA